MRGVRLQFLLLVYNNDPKPDSFLQAGDTPELFKTSWGMLPMEEESIWCFFAAQGWKCLSEF